MNPEHLLDEGGEDSIAPGISEQHESPLQRYKNSLAYLHVLAHDLEAAPRLGAAHDNPEGMRYIMLSDTVAKQIV